MTGKCEFCQNKLSGKEFIICSTCDKSMDNLRVWKGRPTSFNSAISEIQQDSCSTVEKADV